MDQRPFWQVKSLDDMTPQEWESLCDGCGQCCLVRLRDEDDASVHVTRLACALLDLRACRCSDYLNRFERTPGCLAMTPRRARNWDWLPATCAYRLIANGQPLADWHPLVSGDPESVHAAGVSVRAFAVSEAGVPEDEYEDYLLAPRESDGDGREDAASAWE